LDNTPKHLPSFSDNSQDDWVRAGRLECFKVSHVRRRPALGNFEGGYIMAGGSIDGIYSGLNTTSIIDAIMKVEHEPVDLYTARQTEYTNQLTAWQTVNTYLLGFKTQSDVLAQSAIWNSTKVSSSDDTQIAATSTGSPAQGTYFLSIDQVAQNQQIASQGFSESSAIVGTGTVEIKVGANPSKTISLEAGNNSLESLKNAINDSNAGVTAAIINDGSPANPYRLILSSSTSGAANQITFTSNLTGSNAPNFTSKYFDAVEKLSWSTDATSSPFLGTSAEYTGATNKTYTFTIQGSGSQTIGSGPINVAWSDGTNSGTITVNSAGEQIALSGDGADGLSISFADGNLVAGDSFQIQAMSPLIQAGQDAVLRLGTDGSGGSPIVVTSATNRVTTLIDGVTLDLNQVTTDPVQIRVESDYSNITDTVNQFVQKYNAFADFVDQQSSYDSTSGKAGVLLGESSLLTLMSDIRSGVGQKVKGATGSLQQLADVGIKFDTSGRLSVDSSILTSKLNESPDAVRKLFLANGESNNGYISYIASGAKTAQDASGYNVDITQAALQGKFEGGSITDPSVTNLIINNMNNNLIIKINGVTSNTITLTPGA
jgi:flagellar hook-associated protein 2